MAADAAAREGTLTSADGTHLHWRAWEPPAPLAALAVIHGLGEHSGRYARLAEGLARRRISTFAVDLRGMGRSDGRRGHVGRWTEWVQDSAAFVKMVAAETFGLPVVPLGHSFGGVVLTSAVISGALAPHRFVLSNPAFRTAVKVPAWKLRLGRLTSRVAPTFTMSNELNPGLISRDPEQVEAYRTDPLVHDKISARLFTEWRAASAACLRAAPDLGIPFLLILGDADRLIDHTAALDFAQRAAVAHQTRVYPGRYHEPFNDLGSDEVISDLADWLVDHP